MYHYLPTFWCTTKVALIRLRIIILHSYIIIGRMKPNKKRNRIKTMKRSILNTVHSRTRTSGLLNYYYYFQLFAMNCVRVYVYFWAHILAFFCILCAFLALWRDTHTHTILFSFSNGIIWWIFQLIYNCV